MLHAQDAIDMVDFKKIEQKKVRNFLRQQQKQDITSFSELETSVNEQDELSEFINFEKVYIVKEKLEFVWDNYLYSSQTDIWDLNKISFGLLFNRNTESIVYANQYHGELEKGQIYYLNLKILNGVYNLPVAFEMTDVDQENKTISFSYLKGGKAEGIQTIKLEETDKGYTKIIHKSFVKSNSKIRDKYLYPYFHNKLINEFHGNMKKMITQNAKRLPENYAEVK